MTPDQEERLIVAHEKIASALMGIDYALNQRLEMDHPTPDIAVEVFGLPSVPVEKQN